jgi:hypothetical protein
MGEMRSKNRAHVSRPKFGLPEKAQTPSAKKGSGNYPMPDRAHAANAKGRGKQQLKKGNLTREQYDKIVKKADRILGRDD